MAINLLKIESETINNLFPPNQPKDHWYEALWQRLKAPSWNEFKKNTIAIITFNYDRSFEHYFVTILRNQYNISRETAANGLTSFPLLHVHGHLGDYIKTGFGYFIGREEEKDRIKTAISGIQIVHENNGDTPEFIRARNLISDAEKILFIGFGFHPKNMSKLGLRNSMRGYNEMGADRVYGTHKGIKAAEWDSICFHYGFAFYARKTGSGKISELINGNIY